MLPLEVEQLIYEYLECINDYLDLPSKRSIRRLVFKSNEYVLHSLGFVLDLPTEDFIRMRYRIMIDHNFTFYFHLSPLQRIRLIHMIERGMVIDKSTSFLIWIFIMRKPRLLDHPDFRDMFANSLIVVLLNRLRSLHSVF